MEAEEELLVADDELVLPERPGEGTVRSGDASSAATKPAKMVEVEPSLPLGLEPPKDMVRLLT